MSDWAVRLFRKSIVKQAKYANVRRMLGELRGRRCLDIGADNGVISYLLRREGGDWASADMGDEAVRSIRELVGNDVHEIAGGTTPFAGDEFDKVAIVDMLEHVKDDGAFVREMHRILKPEGELIVNVPLKRGPTLLSAIRERCGLTDEEHGHVRPGYTSDELTSLLDGHGFDVAEARHYHKSFTEAIDVLVRFAMKRLGKKKESGKGSIVTRSDLSRHNKTFALFSAAYPVLWCLAQLDRALPFSRGYRLIVRGRKKREA